MFVNIPFICAAMARMTADGTIPAEIHVSQATYDSTTQAIAMSGMPVPSEITLRQKFYAWITRKPIVRTWRINGIPLVINGNVPDGGITVRPIHLLGDPNWMDKLKFEPHRGVSVEQQKASESRQDGSGTTGEAETGVSLNSFVRGQPQGVTEVLMKAMVDCDDARRVIVMKIDSQENLELITNCSRFELFGLLQAAIGRVAQGPD